MDAALTYHDALIVLGAPQSRLVRLLDAAATGGLTIWSAATMLTGKDAAAPLGLLQLKDEIVGYGHAVVRKVSEWHSGLSRFDRSQRLAAAHAVLVVSSYFEALGAAPLPVPIERLEFTAAEKVSLTSGTVLSDGYANIFQLLLREPLPMPESFCSYAEVRAQLSDSYEKLSERLLEFISGLSVWAELDYARRQRIEHTIRDLPAAALGFYDAAYRNLAADNREFAIWAGLTELHALGSGLAGIEALLGEVAAHRPGDRPLSHLLESYRAALEEPIVSAAQAADSVRFPSLGEAYLNPECRIGEVRPGDDPAAAEWWDSKEFVPDIERFFSGYLTSLRAVQAPLVVLGEPGCGKSTLTEVLAARLAEHDFLPVRVQLRDVTAESMILEQIEQAIYRGPGERAGWHDLLEASGGAQPVVLLDGFDELVQAAAVNRYDYLEQVRDFQRAQAHIGHPVAVIVTSRTVVADHARFPAGTLALQLQPFTEAQIRRWLEIWARCNSSVLAARGLRPLPTQTALAHRELAAQPLLLMLLAIFDATNNALQRTSTPLSRAELYEGLFSDFALREVTKSARNRALPARQQRDLAERELHRLAVTAVAMFTRGRQAVTETELNRDLSVLFPEDRDLDHDAADGAAPSPAQRATSRFFFIHKSEARPHDDRARSYEFLHSTFGEFLVARLVAKVLKDMTAMREMLRRGVTAGSSQLDDGFLYAILSFSCMAGRVPIMDFLHELLAKVDGDERVNCEQMLTELFIGSLYPHPSRSFQDYEPAQHPIPRRLASYSANLVLTFVLFNGIVQGSQLFGAEAAGLRWPEYGYLWKGMFSWAEWRAFSDALRAKVSRDSGLIDIYLTREDASPVSPYDSIVVTSNVPFHGATEFDLLVSADEHIAFDAEIPATSYAGRVFRSAAFTPSWHASLLFLQAVPSIRATGGDPRRESVGIRYPPATSPTSITPETHLLDSGRPATSIAWKKWPAFPTYKTRSSYGYGKTPGNSRPLQ